MKGVVFVQFADFIEEKFGLLFWDEVLDAVKPPSEGAYTTVETYPDDEFLSLLSYVCETKGIDSSDAQVLFGRWLFEKLHAIAPPGNKAEGDPLQFLRRVQDVIHVEVKKLNADAILPEFKFIAETEASLTLEYISPRHLCRFCEGIILGLGDYMSHPMEVRHQQCVHNCDPSCVLEVVKKDA